jgi:hypothetical protein
MSRAFVVVLHPPIANAFDFKARTRCFFETPYVFPYYCEMRQYRHNDYDIVKICH